MEHVKAVEANLRCPGFVATIGLHRDLIGRGGVFPSPYARVNMSRHVDQMAGVRDEVAQSIRGRQSPFGMG